MTSRKISRLLTLTWLRCICEKPFEVPRNTVQRTTQHACYMHRKSIHFNGLSALLLHDFGCITKHYPFGDNSNVKAHAENAQIIKKTVMNRGLQNSLERHMLCNYGVLPRCTIAYSNIANAKISKNSEIANQQSYVQT